MRRARTWPYLVILLVVASGRAAPAADETPARVAQPPGGEQLGLANFYAGSDAKMGEFKGKLVCLRTDKSFASTNAEECTANRIFALSVETPPTVIPLLAANEKAQQQMGQLINQEVVVRGKYYTSVGYIAVGDLESAATAKGVGH